MPSLSLHSALLVCSLLFCCACTHELLKAIYCHHHMGHEQSIYPSGRRESTFHIFAKAKNKKEKCTIFHPIFVHCSDSKQKSRLRIFTPINSLSWCVKERMCALVSVYHIEVMLFEWRKRRTWTLNGTRFVVSNIKITMEKWKGSKLKYSRMDSYNINLEFMWFYAKKNVYFNSENERNANSDKIIT